MTKKTYLAAPLLVLLAACGGSSDGSATNPTTTPPSTTDDTTSTTIIKTFGDGAGIVRSQEDGVVLNMMAANINNFNVNSDAIVAVDTSGLSFLSANQYGEFYGGLVTVNGSTFDAIVYGDNNAEVALVYLDGNEGSFVAALGEQVAAIPNGSYTYTGTNVIGVRGEGPDELGTFSMAVNFAAGTAALTGSTPYSTIGGSNISVNTSNGTFSGNNLTLSLSDGEYIETSSAAIQGNFHGAGATGVTGLYYDTYTSIPIIVGAIAGTR